MNIGVIGLGYWGPNIVRNLSGLEQRVFVHDRVHSKIDAIVERFPSCIPVASLDAMFDDPSITALALAVPLQEHCGLVLRSLQAQKHVFVEKPLCATLLEADAIRARLNGSVLMVAHITQFSKGVGRLAGCVREGMIGEICRIAFSRMHMGPVYPSTDVLTEIAAHDVAILTSIVRTPPDRVHAWGVERLGRGVPDAAHVVIGWDAGQTAVIDVQWSGAIRRREIEIEGTKGTLLLRSQNSPEELLHYDHRAAYDLLRNGAHAAPCGELVNVSRLDVPRSEPLRDELASFLECIEHGITPVTDFTFSRNVVAILEAARASMKAGGSAVEVR